MAHELTRTIEHDGIFEVLTKENKSLGVFRTQAEADDFARRRSANFPDNQELRGNDYGIERTPPLRAKRLFGIIPTGGVEPWVPEGQPKPETAFQNWARRLIIGPRSLVERQLADAAAIERERARQQWEESQYPKKLELAGESARVGHTLRLKAKQEEMEQERKRKAGVAAVAKLLGMDLTERGEPFGEPGRPVTRADLLERGATPEEMRALIPEEAERVVTPGQKIVRGGKVTFEAAAPEIPEDYDPEKHTLIRSGNKWIVRERAPLGPGQAFVKLEEELTQAEDKLVGLTKGTKEYDTAKARVDRLAARLDRLKTIAVPEGGYVAGAGTRQPVIVGPSKPMPFEAATGMANLMDQRRSVETLQTLLNDPQVQQAISPYFGYITGPLWEKTQRLFRGWIGRVPPEMTEVHMHVQNVFNYAVRLITGAAVRETEEPRIKDVTPHFGLQDVQEFRQKLGLMLEKVRDYEQMVRILALRGDKQAALTAVGVGLFQPDDLPQNLRDISQEERRAVLGIRPLKAGEEHTLGSGKKVR